MRHLAAAVAVVAALCACSTTPHAQEHATPPADVARESVMQADPPPPQDPAAPACTKAKKEWLRQRAKAEGVMDEASDVAIARGQQVEQLNTQIAQITEALKRGCLEAP